MLLTAAEEVEKKCAAGEPKTQYPEEVRRPEELSDVKTRAATSNGLNKMLRSEAAARLVERSRSVSNCLMKGVRLCDSK